MAATDVTTRPHQPANQGIASTARRLTTETKAALKTTEFYSYLVVLAGLLLAGLLTKAGDGHDDRLQADQVWLYATILTVGYMLSRGLAKSGSRDPYTDDGGNNR
jgi:hypothetical protein